MPPLLTHKQKTVLDFIQEHTHDRGFPPTIREIASRFRFKAVGTVQGYLRALVQKGFLTRARDHARGLAVAKYPGSLTHLPILGHVAAGQPVLAPEHFDGTLPCGELVDKPGTTFALQVRGDSMIEAGIFDGDFVVVEKQATVRDADIVVARVNDEVTVKRFYRVGMQQVRLAPENRNMQPMTFSPPHEIEIIGKVVGMYRKMC